MVIQVRQFLLATLVSAAIIGAGASFSGADQIATLTVDNSTPDLGIVVDGRTAGKINCGKSSEVCKDNISINDEVSLIASPTTEAIFVGWQGDCNGTSPICTVVMSESKTVRAIFEKVSDGSPTY